MTQTKEEMDERTWKVHVTREKAMLREEGMREQKMSAFVKISQIFSLVMKRDMC